MVCHLSFRKRLEGAGANVQRQSAQGQPHLLQRRQQGVVKMEARRGGGHASRGHGENGLVVFLVAFNSRPAHVRGKWCLAQVFEHLCKRGVRIPVQPHRPRAIFSSRFPFDGHVGRGAGHGSVAVRPTLGVPHHRLPTAGFRAREHRLHGRRLGRQQEHFQPSPRGFGGQNPGVQHLGVVGPQAIHPFLLKQIGQRLEGVVRHLTLACANQHLGRPSRVHRLRGDGLLWQRILKLL